MADEVEEQCPYQCSPDGTYLDKRSKSFLQCPVHKQKRVKEARTGFTASGESLAKILGFNTEGLSDEVNTSLIIPKGELGFIESDSVKNVGDAMQDILNDLVLGEKPKKSYCFGLGVKGSLEQVAYPLLMAAYKTAQTVGRFITASEYRRMTVQDDLIEDTYELMSCEFLVVMVNEGCTKGDLSAIKGLMQIRASRGNPTIFVTTWSIQACSTLLGEKGTGSMFLAEEAFVRYKHSGSDGKYIDGIRGVSEGFAGAAKNPPVQGTSFDREKSTL